MEIFQKKGIIFYFIYNNMGVKCNACSMQLLNIMNKNPLKEVKLMDKKNNPGGKPAPEMTGDNHNKGKNKDK